VDKAWQDAGRPGRPRKLTLAYFALGARCPQPRRTTTSCTTTAGSASVAQQIAAGAAVSAEMVKAYAAAFEASGCDEIIFVPTSVPARPDIDLLAEAVA
jgi:hypothetical protein